MGTPVDALARRVQQLSRAASNLRDLAVDLSTEIAIIRRVLADDRSGRLDVAVDLALHKAADARRREQKRAAATGASTLDMRPARGGAALVRVDGREWFRLTRSDARLLRLLVHAAQQKDGSGGWRSYDQVMDAIEEKAGARPTRRAVTESVHRIRRALKSVDVNEFVLQTDDGRLRLLLRPAP